MMHDVLTENMITGFAEKANLKVKNAAFSSSCDTELVYSLNKKKKMFSENFRLFIDFYFSLEVKLEKESRGARARTLEAERGRTLRYDSK